MKNTVLDDNDYRFSPEDKKIYFSSALGLKQKDIFMVINLTKANVMIYNFGCVEEGGTYENNTLTLTYNTTSMGVTDRLMVIVDKKESEVDYLKLIFSEIKNTSEVLL